MRSKNRQASPIGNGGAFPARAGRMGGMTLFSTKGRIAGAVVALVLVAALRPRFGKDYGSMGLWSFMIFMAVGMTVLGIEAVVEKFRKPPA